VVRRDGVYTNSQGLHHFNEQLAEPIMKHIANGWEKTFTRRIPGVFTILVTTVDRLLNTFHDEVEKRAVKQGGNMAKFYMLRNQLQAYREVIKDASNKTKNEISARQKDINREFVPVITLNMLPAYQHCTEERGQGSFKRMKTFMLQHVDSTKQTMFAESTDDIKRRITVMLKDVHDQLEASLDEIFLSMKRNYTQLVIAVRGNAERLPREQRMMRKEVLDVVNGAKSIFERVVGLASPSPEPELRAESVADMSNNDALDTRRTGQSSLILPLKQCETNNLSGSKPENELETPLPPAHPEQPTSTFEEEIAMSPVSDANDALTGDQEETATGEVAKQDSNPIVDHTLAGADDTTSVFVDTKDSGPDDLPEPSDIFKTQAHTNTVASAISPYTPSAAAHAMLSASGQGKKRPNQPEWVMSKPKHAHTSDESEKENLPMNWLGDAC